ncbi:MAG: hypothetical protein AAF597_10080, partial [Bacteroidota bacterium]
LKYNAENDSIFHLSKKYHVNSYPTGLILSQDGKVVARRRGFAGADRRSLGSSVLSFTETADSLNTAGSYLTGYATTIDRSIYPDFYANYVNRTDVDVEPAEINEFLLNSNDPYGEAYFVTLMYFGMEAADGIISQALSARSEYDRRYGAGELDLLIDFSIMGKFRRALDTGSQEDFDKAASFVNEQLGKARAEEMLPEYEILFLEAQGKWYEAFTRYETMKANGEMDHGYINHVSWGAYKKCDDQRVLEKCIDWMKAVVEEAPEFDYLDTYAFLLYKSGKKEQAKMTAKKAIEVGEAEGRKVTGLQKLLAKL